MDKSLVGDRGQVLHDLAIINEIAAQWWKMQGYSIVETTEGKAVVGKNAATGEDNPDALTKTWDDPVELENGQWAVLSPSADPRFVRWRDYIPQGVNIICVEQYVEIPVVTGTSVAGSSL